MAAPLVRLSAALITCTVFAVSIRVSAQFLCRWNLRARAAGPPQVVLQPRARALGNTAAQPVRLLPAACGRLVTLQGALWRQIFLARYMTAVVQRVHERLVLSSQT
jgi:hypothetical protein